MTNVTLVAANNAPKHHVRISQLGALRVLDPEKWADKIRKAMKSTGGNATHAAEKLEISKRQMYRWLDDPRLDDVERAGPGNPELMEPVKRATKGRRGT